MDELRAPGSSSPWSENASIYLEHVVNSILPVNTGHRSFSPLHLVVTAAALLGSYLLLKQLVLHPLARYPGPPLARLTNLYAAYHAWRGSLHTDMYRCHQKYGPYVRYGPNRLLIDTNTAANDINSHKANTIKSKAYQALVHSAPNTLTIRDKSDHSRRRRILSLAFSEAKIQSYENILLRHINNFCSVLGAHDDETSPDSSRDMALYSDWLTFDVMSEVIFGMRYNALLEKKYRYVAEAIQTSNIRVGTLVQAYSLTAARLDRYLFPACIKARNAFLVFIGSLLRDRKKADMSGNGNVFTFLETATDVETGKTLSKGEIRAECATLVVAGSDTSSSAIAAVLFYLSEEGNSRAYSRVCAEIRTKFAALDHVIMGPQLNKCTYLRACIDEAMRMTPPVGGSLWREVGPGGLNVGSMHLPQGVDVGTGIYSLHHNSQYHKDPFSYRPERWLVGEDGTTEDSVALARSAFMPFSSGPRSCVGKGFAYHEMTLCLARLLYQFDMAQDNGYKVGVPVVDGHKQFVLKDHITGAKNGPHVCFTERKG